MIHPTRRTLLTLSGLVVLAVLLILFIVQGLGLPAPELAGAGAPVGAYGPFRLTFTNAVQPASLETRLTLDPAVPGRLVWLGLDMRIVEFIPDRPLAPGQRYTLRLQAGVRGQIGLVLKRALAWRVDVRQPEVLLLSPSQSPDLWRVSADGLARTRLTLTGGKVFDYSASPDGSRVIYSVKNSQDGLDLWEIDLQGGGARLLLPCATDWCLNPVYAPDLTRIIYTRRQASGIPGSQPGAPRLWTLDPITLATGSLVADPSVQGASPAWSPDGHYLAFIDEAAGGMRVLDLPAKRSALYPADTGAGFSWSPDSKSLLFARNEIVEEQPYTVIYRADVAAQTARPFLGADASDPLDYSVPELTPDGAWMAVARRLVGDNPSKDLWLMRADGTQRQSIANDPLSNDASYHWDLTGTRLVFQRLTFGASSSRPQVLVWNRLDGKLVTLSTDAFQPRWVP